MSLSRRECSLLLLPALLANGQAPAESVLGSKFYPFADMPARPNGGNIHWSILDGKTHEGMQVEMHQTQLAPGATPHPPHRHAHEEVLDRKSVV